MDERLSYWKNINLYNLLSSDAIVTNFSSSISYSFSYSKPAILQITNVSIACSNLKNGCKIRLMVFLYDGIQSDVSSIIKLAAPEKISDYHKVTSILNIIILVLITAGSIILNSNLFLHKYHFITTIIIFCGFTFEFYLAVTVYYYTCYYYFIFIITFLLATTFYIFILDYNAIARKSQDNYSTAKINYFSTLSVYKCYEITKQKLFGQTICRAATARVSDESQVITSVARLDTASPISSTILRSEKKTIFGYLKGKIIQYLKPIFLPFACTNQSAFYYPPTILILVSCNILCLIIVSILFTNKGYNFIESLYKIGLAEIERSSISKNAWDSKAYLLGSTIQEIYIALKVAFM